MPIASFLSGAALFHAFPYFPHLCVLGFSAAFSLLVSKRKYAVLVFLVAGALYGLFRAQGPERPSGTFAASGVFVSGAVELPSASGPTYSQEFQAGDDLVSVRSGGEFETGKPYRLNLRIINPALRLNPGARAPAAPYAVLLDAPVALETLEGEGADRGLGAMRARLGKFIADGFGAEQSALISAVITGERSRMRADLREAFNRAGLTHLLSISGTHFAFFSVMLFGLFKRIIGSLPLGLLERFTAHLTPAQGAAVLTIPFMAFYLGISGGSVPAVRAFVMIGLFLLGLLIGRKGAWLGFLFFAAFLLVLHEPSVMLEVSFQLSFLAVFFIGKILRGRPLHPLLRPMLVACAALLGTAPLIAGYFRSFSLISPVANLIVTPIVGFALVPLALLGSFSYLLTGFFIFEVPVNFLAGLSAGLAKGFGSLPFSSVRTPEFPPGALVLYYASLIGFLSSQGQRRRRAVGVFLAASVLALAAFWIYAAFGERPLSVTFLDAGQADSSVVELPDGKVLVIDTGRSGREAGAYLRRSGIAAIDALVLSHSHPDHAGGAGNLMERFKVKEIWDGGRLVYPPGFLNGIIHRKLTRGDYAEGEGYRISVFHPYEGFYTSRNEEGVPENNSSLVLRISGKTGSFLFAGDIEEEGEEDIAHLGGLLKSDVLKAPHHGWGSSVHEGFFGAVSPEAAVVPAKRPAGPELKEALRGSRILLTGEDGAVKIEEKKGALKVKTFREHRLARTKDIGGEIENIKRLFRTW